MDDLLRSAIESLADIEEMEVATGELIRSITIRPEFDCWERCHFDKPTCKPRTGGWHGIGSRRITWAVAVRGRGAVALELSANVYTEAALARDWRVGRIEEFRPSGAVDIHHASPPDYLESWGPKECTLIGGDCWSDVSYLASDEGWECYIAGRSPAVFTWLGEKWLPDVLSTPAASVPKEATDG